MSGIFIIGAIVAVAILATAAKAPKYEIEADAEDIREGVKNGWYTCVLTRQDNKPAAILSGKMTNGEDYSGLFFITESDWRALEKEGYKVEL